MKLIVYTLPYKVTNEADKINHLFEEGLKELHIRKPGYKTQELEDLILSINSKYLNKVILHSNYDLAKKYNLKGIHVPSNFFDGVGGFVNKLNYKSIDTIYTSVYSCNKLNTITFPFTKVFLGPLYKRFSATQTVPNFNIFELKEVLFKSDNSVAAMGGINLNNFKEISSLNFKGIVVQSALWKSDDYLNAFRAFKLLSNSNNKEKLDTKSIAI